MRFSDLVTTEEGVEMTGELITQLLRLFTEGKDGSVAATDSISKVYI
jgi:hypothetical protein